ncbi:NUDIX domain-containing protein [Microbacterium gorillae]|uniref:NUDIX domain-containing protein n=1 Tax=Microbacterium gorillae TaxID=1231063 RepID=UPI00058F4031|nr:NUDIX domain-containing protein [Microbacterium gorillae]
MTIVPPEPGEPRRPQGPRDPGDAWVIAESGERYWGRFGAAGLLAVDEHRGVLLQHRVAWSHFGGTWGIPGGALHEGESVISGALRESSEEAGVPGASVRPLLAHTLDKQVWSYTTIVATVVEPFTPEITDPESVELRWVPKDEVLDLPLHPGFAAAWPELVRLMDVRPVIVVDVANLMGSQPDGWWKDRAGAAQRWLERLADLAAEGIDAARFGRPGIRFYPWIVAVLEGAARDAADVDGIHIVRAPGAGDDAVVAAVALAGDEVDLEPDVTAVTSDRELQERVRALGVVAEGVSWLRELIDEVPSRG